MKNVLLLSNDARIIECLSLALYFMKHTTRYAARGDTGISILNEWSPELIIVGELEDMHAAEIAHVVATQAIKRPFMVAIHRTFGHPEIDRKYQIRCAEHGFDVTHRLPVSLFELKFWCDRAYLTRTELVHQ